MKILSVITYPHVVFLHQKTPPKTFFNNVFTNILCWQVLIKIEAYAGVIQLSDLIKNILICVPKMNKSLMGLEQHEGE